MRYRICSQVIEHACYKVCICKGQKIVYTFDCMNVPETDFIVDLKGILPEKVFSALISHFIRSIRLMYGFYKKDFK